MSKRSPSPNSESARGIDRFITIISALFRAFLALFETLQRFYIFNVFEQPLMAPEAFISSKLPVVALFMVPRSLFSFTSVLTV